MSSDFDDPSRQEEEALLRSVALQNAKTVLPARQRAEQELREANAELEQKTQELARYVSALRATLEATTDGIVVADKSERISGYNRRCQEMWRVPDDVMSAGDRAALVRFASDQLRDPDAFLRRVEDIERTSPGESFDTLEFADGRVYERFSRIQQVDNADIGRVWSLRDITEPRRTENGLLDECGALAYTAEHATTAVRLVEDERPQVTASDIGMPDIDGYGFLKRVRELGDVRGGGVPAIALTAFARPEDRARALRAGFLAHVSKPVEPSEPVATVASVVGRTGLPPRKQRIAGRECARLAVR